ncbi:MAG: multiheme c-type cytochrome [Xanthomonadales bacterium]|nr:multiheme c-type cytochrome [Xanthomonadales bacterium]
MNDASPVGQEDSARPPMKSRPPAASLAPRMFWLLLVTAFALLAVSGAYLGVVTLLEWSLDQELEDYLYQLIFIAHLAVGVLVVVPLLCFAVVHVKRAWYRRNPAARTLGVAILLVSLMLLLTGLLVSRLGVFEAVTPQLRQQLYWLHLICAALLVPVFLWHRLRGHKRIDWRMGGRVMLASGATGILILAAALAIWTPEPVPEPAQPGSIEDFDLSLAKTASGRLIEPEILMRNDYCLDCHQESHEGWMASAHRFSSFNNPAYAFSVRELRTQLIAEGKPLDGVMFCAACHDPVPLFAGMLRDPGYDDVNHPTATEGVNCLSCHAITSVDSARGNGDYTIGEPQHYPFAFSEISALSALSRQLIRAKPALHKRTFLKPLHASSEFCSTCHKVFLPQELNAYKWLRGQNHYDSFELSGVSGQGVAGFYYPPKARENCQECHMPADSASQDMAANPASEGAGLVISDHTFAAANSGIWPLMKLADPAVEKREAMLKDSVRLDLFGLREQGTVDGKLLAPLRPTLPTLTPGQPYLVEAVLRNLRVGHTFTEGTADSNEVWVQIEVRHEGQTILASGLLDENGAVDPWSHFINVYMLDREGRRIDRRNVRDIFFPLYNNQIPPGAADVVHYLLEIPPGLSGSVEIEAKLLYRKFDATYVQHIRGGDQRPNDLPIMLISSDRVVLPLLDSAAAEPELTAASAIAEWERWNDYGIGLLRKQGPGGRSQLRQANEAFHQVEALGHAEGALNAARVHLTEGDLEAASQALRRAHEHSSPAYPWSIAWFSGQVSKQRGHFDLALENFMALEATQFDEAHRRGFDFSRDYNLLAEIGQTLFERARQRRASIGPAAHQADLLEAMSWYERVLLLDADNANAHFNLAQIKELTGDLQGAELHRNIHQKLKPDENAIERAVSRRRALDPAADHAAERVVIYALRAPAESAALQAVSASVYEASER